MHEKGPVKFVYFDLDDTLVDTTTAVASGFRAAVVHLEKTGAIAGHRPGAAAPVDIIPGIVESFRSLFPREILAALLIEYNGELPDDDDVLKRAVEVFREELLARVRPFPEVPETLSELARRRIGRGLLTDGRTDHQRAKLRAAGLEGTVEPVIISGTYPPFTMKPSQVLFHDAVQAVGLDPRNIAYVGDLTKDVVGANIAGMVSVRVLQGRANAELHEPRLAVERPDYVIEDIPAVLGLLDLG